MGKPTITTIFLVALFFALPVGCKKTGSSTGLNFQNTQDIVVNVNIYGSLADYVNGTNVLAQGRIPANGSENFSGGAIKAGQWYYYDVFSDDYSYTNWVDDDDFEIGMDSTTPRRVKFDGGNQIFNAVTSQTTARTALLNNTRGYTTWVAVDALDLSTGDDIWYTLTPQQQFATMKVRKDHTGTFYYLYGSDTVYSNFSFGSINGYPVYNVIFNETALNSFITGTTVNPILYTYQPPSTDSAVMLINGYLYIMAKQ